MPLTPAIGKLVRAVLRLTRHGGSALPGKVIECIDPGFLARTLARLPLGVVLVSGTNGKTTTTRMVASMLSDLGLRVFTNPTGSNFTRGVVSALIGEVDLGGRLDADIAVLELDEAYAVHFVRQVKPRYALLLNVMRDQLDRFGEIDHTAQLLAHVAEATSGTVVLNREDPRIAALAASVPDGTRVHYFGLTDSLKRLFPSDDDMTVLIDTQRTGNTADGRTDAVPRNENGIPPADVTLTAVGEHEATFLMDGVERHTSVRLEGVYNLYNAAAALALVRAVAADDDAARRMQTDTDALMTAVAHVTPAFGRGEIIDVHGSPVELVLVKNPMGFRLALTSFAAEGHDTMIAINDEYADGRDMSWLWDVDFTSLRSRGVAMVSGVRAWDMALRLGYDDVPVAAVDPDMQTALNTFLNRSPGTPKRIYCTYTVMLRLRAALGHMTAVSDAGVGR